jgi:anti-sigma-K factor RskA
MSEAEPSTPGSGLSAALGWLAAAAAIAIAAVMFVSGNTGPQPATGPQANAGDATDAEADVSERLAALEQRDDTISSDWNPWPNDPGNPGYAGDASEVSGRVVWNDELQEGYMVFEGLDPNDPSEAQYQLWIVTDGEQEHPVDGGVFDVPDDDRVIVPIDPKLAIQRTPAAFGVTVEKPGGVVVSDQDRRVVVGVPSQDG